MMPQSTTLPLLIITLTHIFGSSLAAPGPPTKPTPNSPGSREQLDGVPGPYFDGAEGADRAGVAGILATLILHEEDGGPGNESESNDKNANSDLSLFVVMNEYKDDKLIRQSNCFQEIQDGVSVFNTICSAIIGYPMVEGSLDLTNMQTMLKEYLTVETDPELTRAMERRKTMNLIMENAESGFSLSVESEGATSEKIILGKGEDLYETETSEGVFDFIWKPKDDNERHVEPYNWTEGEALAQGNDISA